MVEKVKYKKSILFSDNSNEYFLFQIVNIGKESEDDFKFIFNNPDDGTSNIYMDDGLKFDKETVVSNYTELTYHPDGTILYKFPKYPIKSRKHINPESTGYRRTPLTKIKNWESLFIYKVYDYNLCIVKQKFGTEEDYIIKDFEVINKGLPFYAIVSITTDIFVPPKLYNSNLEKNIIIINIGQNLNLWIALTLAMENGYGIEMEGWRKNIYSKNNKIEIVERKF